MQTRRAITMEFLGTATVTVGIVGSVHVAAYLASDNGLKLFINALATGISLAVAIRIGMKISGAHFNPVVTIIILIIRKIQPKIFVLYVTAQVLGAICGCAFANHMFDQKLFQVSSISRDGSNLFVSELFTTYKVSKEIFDSMMYIVIAGLGFTASEKFTKKEDK